MSNCREADGDHAEMLREDKKCMNRITKPLYVIYYHLCSRTDWPTDQINLKLDAQSHWQRETSLKSSAVYLE